MADNRGFHEKYVVRRTDGRDEPGEKHHGCQYFVLDLDHDPCAAEALRAYARACEQSRPRLFEDLRTLIHVVEARTRMDVQGG